MQHRHDPWEKKTRAHKPYRPRTRKVLKTIFKVLKTIFTKPLEATREERKLATKQVLNGCEAIAA